MSHICKTCFYKVVTYLSPSLLLGRHLMEKSTHKAPFLLVLQGPYEGAELSKQETKAQKVGPFSSVTQEPQVPGIPQP